MEKHDSPTDTRDLLSIERLHQSWPDQAEALFDIEHVSWSAGQHVWLQGANGSGKTTFMRLLSGLEPVQQGRIDLFKKRSGAEEPRICYLHQTPYLFAGSVERNLQFVIRSLASAQRPAARVALDLGLQLAGLEGLRHQDAVTLSGGERQRLALLRAWLLQPDILLLDEPAANLDDDSVVLMHRLVTDLIEKGASIMVSSHQKNLLTKLCNTRWLIASGTLTASSLEAAASLRCRPA
ncbi:ATP-binding cassette domain-containing protein [Oceanospirillum linum]|nr:ATP-binding cassette domain-containing protein [Oceanospirillum linum]SEF96056.1 tungstate transport system ATP-binding protein [Oleiphilus messinensis]SMP11496.1 tungstate transport system ATP-binding protein [Oceanospirillum linum]